MAQLVPLLLVFFGTTTRSGLSLSGEAASAIAFGAWDPPSSATS